MISSMIFFFCTFVLFVVVPYQMIRNYWVCKQRMALIDEDFEEFKKLPSYDYMLYRKFWIWDIEEFKK